MKWVIDFVASGVIILGALWTTAYFIGPMTGDEIWWYFTGLIVAGLLVIKEKLLRVFDE